MWVVVAEHLTEMALLGFRVVVVVVRRVEVMGMVVKGILGFLRNWVFGFWRRRE